MTVIEPEQEIRSAIVVIGSGPGGAVTAATLAAAGREVLLVEEGSNLAQDSCAPFSFAEMKQKYRSGGITVAMGRPNIAYAEGSCVGGGSEVNSGLYHRTPAAVIDEWARDFGVADFSSELLEPQFAACEAIMQPVTYPDALPVASKILREGAHAEGWLSVDVPRLVQFESERDEQGVACSKRHSMSTSFLPQFFASGGALLPETRVDRLAKTGKQWDIRATHRSGAAVRIVADQVFVCAGAIHSPALLRRSGITRNIGRSLALQPMLKLTAEFAEPVNFAGMGIGGEQVKEFSPDYSFGCAISAPAHLAINLAANPDDARRARENFRHYVSYYVMSRGLARGSVGHLPGFRDPLVRYTATQEELFNLGTGARNLARLLLSAGARKVYTGVAACPEVSGKNELAALPDALPRAADNVMTIHLMSACPMGENRARAAVDSWGRVHQQSGLYVSDVSILCTSPGVNPQGTIMALARRNAEHFLDG